MRRKHITNACDACRQRKIKCDGKHPCNACAGKYPDCTYDWIATRGDLRSRRLTATDHSDLQNQKTILYQLIEAVRNNEADKTLTLIKNGANEEVIAQSLRDLHLPVSQRQVTDLAGPVQGLQTAHQQLTSPMLLPKASTTTLQLTHHPYLGESVNVANLGGATNNIASIEGKVGLQLLRTSHSLGHENSVHGHAAQHLTPAQEYIHQYSSWCSNPDAYRHSFDSFSAVDVTTDKDEELGRNGRMGSCLPEYLQLPLIQEDDSAVGQAFIKFLGYGYNMVKQEGWSAPVLDLDYDVELLFRNRRPDDPFTASTWACELTRPMIKARGTIACLANAVGFTGFMRWLLFPCADTYFRVPSILRPTKLQRTIPHSAAIALYLSSDLRDSMIRTSDITEACTEMMDLKPWPYDSSFALVTDEVTKRLKVSQEFIEFACSSSSWTKTAI